MEEGFTGSQPRKVADAHYAARITDYLRRGDSCGPTTAVTASRMLAHYDDVVTTCRCS